MPLREGIKRLYREFKFGVSYKSGEIGEKLIDSLNYILVQNKAITRPGIAKFTSQSMSDVPQSLSFYVKDDGTTRALIAKTGTTMQAASTDGVFSSIKTGLTSSNIHDAVTMNGRHILAIGSDGLFSYDGTIFAALGVSAPGAATIAASAGGALSDATYTLVVTFVCQSTGFETNQGTTSNSATTSSGGGNSTITVTAIPVSTHPLVTHKNVYLRSGSGNFLFVSQLANATTTTTITANPASTSDVPPTGKDTPLSGGAKYLALFNDQIISAGNSSFPSDVFFSNTDEPDGWDTANSLVHAQGEGPITAIAVGYFRGSAGLNQYLVAFKKRTSTIYFQSIDNPANDTQIIISGVGCVSHKTIRVKDGDIYFLSDYGWRVIANGKLIKETLANGDVDDIFRINGFAYGLNKTQIQNSFATYYSELDSYMCWVPEGSQTSFNKCYNYHMDVGQFMPLQFTNSTCAVTGEDGNGNEVVYMGNNDKNIYSYSIRNNSEDISTTGFHVDISSLDVDTLEAAVTNYIPTLILFNWQPNEDYDATYNFRDLTIEGIGSTSDALSTATIKAFLNFNRSTLYQYTYDFFAAEGFTLDVSMLDVGILADERTRARVFSDINRTARNILIGVYQDVLDAKLQLIAYQLNFSKNGNRN
jgi:hypothetical protein